MIAYLYAIGSRVGPPSLPSASRNCYWTPKLSIVSRDIGISCSISTSSLSYFSIERASSSFSFQLATVKLYVENQIILNVNNFDSFSDQQLSCDPLFGTERRTTACARPRILIGQRNCQLSQKLGPSPDNEGLNIKNCILAARTLNVPLFYGDTWAESKMASRPSNAIRPPAFLSLGQGKLQHGYAPPTIRSDTIPSGTNEFSKDEGNRNASCPSFSLFLRKKRY